MHQGQVCVTNKMPQFIARTEAAAARAVDQAGQSEFLKKDFGRAQPNITAVLTGAIKV